jgi:hypothetical protein
MYIEQLERVVAAWGAAAVGRQPPAVEDLHPRDFPELLPFAWIVAIEPDFMRSRLTMFGGGVGRLVGGEWTGRTLAAIELGPEKPALIAPLRVAVEGGRPLLVYEQRRGAGEPWLRHHRLLLPCRTRRVPAIVRLLGFIAFESPGSELRWSTTLDEWETISAEWPALPWAPRRPISGADEAGAALGLAPPPAG